MGIDTATLVSSVALAEPDTVIAELTIQTKKNHSERLMPNIAQILDNAGIQKESLQAIAISIGPGSFTGLRIGLATAKALAYTLKIPIIGVHTLMALAYSLPVPGVLLSPWIDAQRGNVYHALYQWENGELKERKQTSVASYTDVLNELTQYDSNVVIIGDAAKLYANEIREKGQNIILAEPHVQMPRAGTIALLGCKILETGHVDDVMTIDPLYIRRSEAEVLWEKRCGESER